MNISLKNEELYKGFSAVAGAIPRTTTMTVLQGAKLETRSGKAELTATNLSISIKYQFETLLCGEDGAVVLPAARITKITKELPDSDDIILTINSLKCTLESSKGSFVFLGESPDNFPKIQGIKAGSFTEIDSDTLGSMIHKVGHAAFKEMKETTLSGVLIKIDNDDITMVTISTARLSMVKRKVVNPDNISAQAIIPVSNLSTLKSFLSEYKNNSAPIKIAIDNSRACFWNEKAKFLYQLMGGEFVHYEDIIKLPRDKVITINKDELLSLVRATSYMTNEMRNYIKFEFADKKLTISTINNTGNTRLTATPIFDVPDTDLYFNPQYILDMLSVAEDEITMEFADNNSSVLFGAGYEHQEVVMTMDPPGEINYTANTKESAHAA